MFCFYNYCKRLRGFRLMNKKKKYLQTIYFSKYITGINDVRQNCGCKDVYNQHFLEISFPRECYRENKTVQTSGHSGNLQCNSLVCPIF